MMIVMAAAAAAGTGAGTGGAAGAGSASGAAAATGARLVPHMVHFSGNHSPMWVGHTEKRRQRGLRCVSQDIIVWAGL